MWGADADSNCTQNADANVDADVLSATSEKCQYEDYNNAEYPRMRILATSPAYNILYNSVGEHCTLESVLP